MEGQQREQKNIFDGNAVPPRKYASRCTVKYLPDY
jgi:hypothetical protein